jgi:Ca-activated chloride channel homolog
MTRLEFIFPMQALPIWLGLAAVLVGGVAVLIALLERRRRRRMDRFIEAALAPRLLDGYDTSVRRPLSFLTVLGCLFLALALFQPHWGETWQEVGQASRDILVLLDTSESMNAGDILPTRIERARQEIQALMARGPADRFGLVAFSGAAALQAPLTLDHAYLRTVLNAVDTGTISRKGTNISEALRVAKSIFEEEDRQTGRRDTASRAVVLISDGEEIEGDAVNAAGELAPLARVFAIGIGNPDGAVIQMPEWMAAFGRRNEGPATHVSRLDEDTLMKIANAGGGAYVRSQADEWDMDQLYDRFRTLSAREVSSQLRFRLVNRYQWPLALAVACFMAEGLWLALLRPWTRWRRSRRKPETGHA